MARPARLACLLLLVAFASRGAGAQADGTAQTGSKQAGALLTRVSVPLTAVGKDGRPLGDLKPEDIRVTAAGAVRQVLELKPRGGLPLYLAVMLDVSASQETVLPATKALADAFVSELIRPGVDSAAFVAFADDLKVEQGMTSDPSEVRAAVERARFVPPPGYVRGGIVVGPLPPRKAGAIGGMTGVWDAVRRVAAELMPPPSVEGRRVLLLISDGVDTSSSTKLEKAAAEAIRSGAVVYAVGVIHEDYMSVEAESLRKLAARTGGRAFLPKGAKDLPGVLAPVRADLLSQYAVAFEAPAAARGGAPEKLKIELVNPELRRRDVRLSYPQGYYAGGAPAADRR